MSRHELFAERPMAALFAEIDSFVALVQAGGEIVSAGPRAIVRAAA